MEHKTTMNMATDKASHEGSDALMCTVIEKLGEIAHRCGMIKSFKMEIIWEEGGTYLTPFTTAEITDVMETPGMFDANSLRRADPFSDRWMVNSESDLNTWIGVAFSNLFDVNGNLRSNMDQEFQTFLTKMMVYIERLNIILPCEFYGKENRIDQLNDLLRYLKMDSRIIYINDYTLKSVTVMDLENKERLNHWLIPKTEYSELEYNYGFPADGEDKEIVHWLESLCHECYDMDRDRMHMHRLVIEMIRMFEYQYRKAGGRVEISEIVEDKISRINKIITDFGIFFEVEYYEGILSIKYVDRDKEIKQVNSVADLLKWINQEIKRLFNPYPKLPEEKKMEFFSFLDEVMDYIYKLEIKLLYSEDKGDLGRFNDLLRAYKFPFEVFHEGNSFVVKNVNDSEA